VTPAEAAITVALSPDGTELLMTSGLTMRRIDPATLGSSATSTRRRSWAWAERIST
jgi:hypothetical protein